MDERRLEQLVAEQDINEVQRQYSALCDQGFPADDLAEFFAENAIWESSPNRVVVQGRHAIGAHLHDAGQAYDWSMHINIPLGVTLAETGETARGKWHLLMPCTDRSGGEPHAGWLAGSYCNDFVRTYTGWKISHLRVTFQLVTPHLTDWAPNRFQNLHPSTSLTHTD